MFGSVDTGVFTPWGTKAFFAASKATNDTIFNNRGEISKQQYNAKIYQPIGDNGDFISIAAHYNEAYNNRFGSVTFRNDGAGAVPSRSEEHTSELQSLMRISYAGFCLKK